MENNLITKEDIIVTLPELGETIIVLQRNAEEYRSGTKVGQLLPEAATMAYNCTTTVLTELFASLTTTERAKVDVLVIASDPRLGVRNKIHTESMRSIDTAKEVLRAANDAMQASTIAKKQLLNTTAVPDGGVVEISEIKTALPIHDSPELIEFLQTKGAKNIWDNYHRDTYKTERETTGIEGPKEIAERLDNFLSCVQATKNYHVCNPNRRLVFWMVTHFDTIAPYLELITEDLPSGTYPVDHLGGIILHIKKDASTVVTVQKNTYQTNLNFSAIITG